MKYIFLYSIILLHFSFVCTTQKCITPSFFEKQWQVANNIFLQKYMRTEMHRVYGQRPKEGYGFFMWHATCMIEMKKFFQENNDLFYLSLYNNFKNAEGLFIHTHPQSLYEKRAVIINPQKTMRQASPIPMKYFFDAILHHELVHLEQSELRLRHFWYKSLNQQHDISDYEYEADIKSGERVANPYAHYYVLKHAVKNQFSRPKEYASFELLLDIQEQYLNSIHYNYPTKYLRYKTEFRKSLKQ